MSDDAQTYPKGRPSNLGKGQATSFWALFFRNLNALMTRNDSE